MDVVLISDFLFKKSSIVSVLLLYFSIIRCDAFVSKHKVPESPLFKGSRALVSCLQSFPLDSCGGFGGDVIDDSVYVFDFVYDAVRRLIEEFVRQFAPVGGHKVGR